ncbi:glucose-6-phosphatase a, catalytic subunit, tandem duplicate 1 [Anabas testudineus]|uniref:Glucose-6-phosphatase n=1 Tax=Anabas testudineus TaxID=64144 RepID=A0A3Q1HRZ1_ANATE|nr:glucose-6-phosphatase a, catalytic subunit, tandem duplicate 1 [Anabas testudineus]XP_026207428.1 glucose-6-phosphatase a, catalytic subunit, tandem duplicate 1 [Anabas testudineus]XP_026207429.1 glucose-6-phosphatase a, catalytic subunit, tandem duplicate 1 [Anabas testudineus]
MDLLHSWGVELAVHLQTKYSKYEDLFGLASTVADLHTTFFWLFPIWFHLRRDTGLRLLWVAVIGDWLNLVLKWVLCGERPYWWVHETRFYGAGPAPSLHQFSITCETGPGSPSGHAMGAAGVWFVMVTALLSVATGRRCPPLINKFLQIGLWMLMGLVLLVVCMSRVYMAAHFPHQVIAGVITGLVVAQLVSNQKWIYTASMNQYFFTTLFLTSFAVGFYLLLKALGVDLLWTLDKAQKWCIRPEWVHLDTTPFASLLRNMGSLFGLGLGLHSPLYNSNKKNTSAIFKIGCITVSLFLLQFLDGWTFSAENHMTFYFLSFSKSVVALLVPTTMVPWALCWICSGKEEDKNL